MSLRVVGCMGVTFVLGWAVGSGQVTELFHASHGVARADDPPNREEGGPVEVEGVYRQGAERNAITIRKLGDGVYSFVELEDNNVYEGIGIYKDGVLAIGWDNAGNPGVSHIRVTRGENGEPVLDAYWTVLRADVYEPYDPMPEYVGPVRNSR